MKKPSIDEVQAALDDVLTSDAVADLPENRTPSEDDFESETEFREEMEFVGGCEFFVDLYISSVSRTWPDALRDMFRLMAWQHINFKTKYRLQYPSLHPETIV